MPAFLYTILVLSIAAWAGLFRYVSSTPPETVGKIFIFLGILLLALVLTLSLPVYFALHSKAPTFSNLRFLYRKSLKWSAFFSFGVVFLMALRALQWGNIVNVSLFLILYLMLFMQFRSQK